jgi:uncharacterized protein with von Willebrand factor type A (vWA) domain
VGGDGQLSDGWGPAEAGVPDGVDLASVAGRFGRFLHGAGLPVSPDTSSRLAAALALAPPATVRDLYWLARVTMVNEHGQLATFDRVFAHVFGGASDPADWRGQSPPAAQAAASSPAATGGAPAQAVSSRATNAPLVIPATSDGDGAGDGEAVSEGVLAAASADERLHTQDFSALTDDELASLRALMSQTALSAPMRRGRRRRRAVTGRHLDLRATLRRAQRTGGDPAGLVRRRRLDRPRRLVLICDISGSMQPYARAYLQLLLSGVGAAKAEAFVFATRLTRLTPSLRAASPDVALGRAARAAPDWSGGTRIGEAIHSFNDRYGRRGLARGAVVVILSDGWDCGDPALLDREMGRLRRLAHRVIWVNPRRAAVKYEPLTSGMVAALPHVHAMRSGHSLNAMKDLLAAIRDDNWPAGVP